MAKKGSKQSEETKKKISLANKGKKYGPRSAEAIQKAVEGRKGYKHSEETKRKISESNKIAMNKPEVKIKMCGDNNPAKRPEVREKISIAKTGYKYSEESKKHVSEALIGRKLSDDHRKNISNALKNRPRDIYKKMGEKHSGPNHWNWKDGKSYEPYCPKWTPELRERIRAFFNYECVLCGKTKEENSKDHRELSCHHVEYNKDACCDGKPVHFALLCNKCHGKMVVNTEYWMNILHRIIDEIYNGRSYYTKDEYELIIKELSSVQEI